MSLIDLIFPKLCVGCGLEGGYICPSCQKNLVTPEQVCPLCAKPSLDGWTHSRCKTSHGLDRLMVGLSYRGMVQQCLKKVKYKSSWDVIDFLSSLTSFPIDEGIVVAVPMYSLKERERGFNQAERIAELLTENNNGRIFVKMERTRATRPMFGLTKEARRENVRGAFSIKNEYTKAIKDQRVIIVDDVWTTGATLIECARVLKRVGVKEVWGVTLAR